MKRKARRGDVKKQGEKESEKNPKRGRTQTERVERERLKINGSGSTV